MFSFSHECSVLKFPSRHRLRNFRVGLKGSVVALRAKEISNCIALEHSADASVIPMDILKAALGIGRRSHAEVGLVPVVPRAGQIPHLE